MTKEKKLRIIGLAMCLPAVIMAIYLALHLGILVIAGLTALSTALCVYGITLAKGGTLEDIKKDMVDDYNDLRD